MRVKGIITMVPLTRGRPLVLTFDAFGTLFHPCRPIGQQYAEAARMHGLSGFTDKDIEASFPKGKQKGTDSGFDTFG